MLIGKDQKGMMIKGKSLLIILAVTGFARVAIFAIPVVGIYFGVNSTEQHNERH